MQNYANVQRNEGKLAKTVDSAVFRAIGRKIAKTRISDTERAALESGDVGIERGYFNGRVEWDKLRSLPVAKLSAEEEKFINRTVAGIASRINATEILEKADLPEDVWSSIKEEKIWGMIIGREYGGLGFSPTAHSEMIVMLGSVSAAAAVTAMVPNSLGPGELLMHYGTESQKEKWLPRLADGREIPCFALTSLNGGSDASGGMYNTGTVFMGEDGRPKIRLDISNRYITLAPVATLVGVSFILKDPDNLLGKGKNPGITLAIAPADTPNLIAGKRHNPMGIPFQNGPLSGNGVVIDAEESIIGGASQAGNGWSMLMESLAVGRAVSLPALSASAAKVAAMYVGAYARIREQFNTSISNFQGIKEPLARIAGYTYIIDSARKTTLQMLEAGKKPTVTSAIIKYHLTEMMRSVCNDSMDIMAGKGVMNGPKNILSELYSAVPIGITVEGANIMTRSLIIFGQGLMRAHPNLYPMLKAAQDGDEAGFRVLFARHVKDIARYFADSELGTSRNRGIPEGVPKELRAYYRQINRLSAGFAFSAALLSGLYQDKLKFEEDISKRLGDMLSYLYLSTSVLNNFEARGMQKGDIPLVHWSMQHLLSKFKESYDDLADNLPNRAASFALKQAMFAGRASYRKPSDKLGYELVGIITGNGETKERLVDGIYRPASGERFTVLGEDGKVRETETVKPQALINDALSACIAAEPAVAKMRNSLKSVMKPRKGDSTSAYPNLQLLVSGGKAEDKELLMQASLADGVITREEFNTLKTAERLRIEVTEVDTFASDMHTILRN
jgi:acyl-CoA dehydrogenase